MRAGGKEERCCGDPRVSRGTAPGRRPGGGGGAPRGGGVGGPGDRAGASRMGGGWLRPPWGAERGGYGSDSPSRHGTAAAASLIASAPARGAVECGGGRGSAGGGQGQRVGRGTPLPARGLWCHQAAPVPGQCGPPVSARGLWQVPREREHVPVSSSAVPLAPGRGYGLRGSGEGSWDGHPATLKQSEQKRWDETRRLVHEMKPSSPAGRAARPPRASLLAPAPPRPAPPPDHSTSPAQPRLASLHRGRLHPKLSLGGQGCPLDIAVSPPGERSARRKPRQQPRAPRRRGNPGSKERDWKGWRYLRRRARPRSCRVPGSPRAHPRLADVGDPAKELAHRQGDFFGGTGKRRLPERARVIAGEGKSGRKGVTTRKKRGVRI